MRNTPLDYNSLIIMSKSNSNGEYMFYTHSLGVDFAYIGGHWCFLAFLLGIDYYLLRASSIWTAIIAL